MIRYNQALEDVGSVRIDYNWISSTGQKARVGLGLFGLDSYWDGNGNFPSSGVYIKSIGYGSDGSLGAIDGARSAGVDYQIAYSTPWSGSLLIQRDGSSFTASYLDGRELGCSV